MNTSPGAVFRIPILGWSVALLVIFATTFLLAVGDLPPGTQWSLRGAGAALLSPVLIFALFGAYTFWVFRFEITPAGMRLYRVNRASWDEITSARTRRVLFLPYLHLTRHEGMSWWVPLYFVGGEPISAALLRYSPEGHPIRHALRAPDGPVAQTERA